MTLRSKICCPNLVQIILDAVDKPRVISFKGAIDLVTETDKRSEEAIIKVCWRHRESLTLSNAASRRLND